MNVLVLGATGKTGRWVVRHLLGKGISVKAIVRSSTRFESIVQPNDLLMVIEGSILDMTQDELGSHMKDCDGVVSCLGHNLTMKGIFGPPFKLCTQAITKACEAAREVQGSKKMKVILMNTTGNRNKDLDEKVSFAHKVVLGILRALIPPQRDNESAAEYLRTSVGQKDEHISWVAVRPDGLVDDDQVTDYSIHPSPLRDPIFDAGKTSRINVAHFMAELITDEALWIQWDGQMPVIYNR